MANSETQIRRLGGLLLLLAVSCAKVAPPQPPLRAPAAPLSGLQLVAEAGSRLGIQFQTPGGLERVRLLRRCENETDEVEVLDLTTPELTDGIGAGMGRIEDPVPPLDRPCVYRLRFEVSGRAGLTPELNWIPVAAAEPPIVFEPKVEENGVRLQWRPPARNTDGTSPARIEAYLINGATVVEQPSYFDAAIVWGEPRRYEVQTISRRDSLLLLSAASDAVSVVPIDSFPPPAPANVSGGRVGQAIQLVWDASQASDVGGYFVYRGTARGQLEKVSPLLLVNRYTDEIPPGNPVVYYRVVAVDKQGNESAPSDLAQVGRN